MNAKITSLFCLACLLFFSTARSAFPVQLQPATNGSLHAGISEEKTQTISLQKYTNTISRLRDKIAGRYPEINGRRVAAILTGAIFLFSVPFFALGIHRMIYGYWGIGLLQLLGGAALGIGMLVTVTFILGDAALWFGIPVLLIGAVAWVWQLTDVIRILSGSLVPNGGNRHRGAWYKHRNR